MDIQGHERTVRIKKWSGHLYHVLTWMRYLAWAAFPLAFMSLWPSAKVTGWGIDPATLSEPGSLAARNLFVLANCFFLFMLQRFLGQVAQLMAQFRRGAIFSTAATQAARQALSSGTLLFLFELANKAVTEIMRLSGPNPAINISIDSLIIGLVAFGVMYVLLWTLEVGHAMQQESELTV